MRLHQRYFVMQTLDVTIAALMYYSHSSSVIVIVTLVPTSPSGR